MIRFERFSVFLVAVFLAICPGCGRQQEAGVPPELQAAIDSFYTAIENGDGEARIRMFTDDAIMLPNHWTRIEGKEAITEVIRSGEGAVFRIRDREIVDIRADGHLAYTVNSYFFTYHLAGGEPQWHKTKNVHIWRRDSAGDWKLHVDIWNSDVPINDFIKE